MMRRRNFAIWSRVATHCGAAMLVALIAGPARAADPAPILKPSVIQPASGQFWAEIDYLGWSVRGMRLPALVTTSPVGTPIAQTGILGAPGTSVLFGNSSINDDWRSGARLQLGYWFDPGRRSGLEASVFGLERISTRFNANSNNNPILAQPFFDPIFNQQSALFSAFPGFLTGSITASGSSSLLGAGGLYRQDIWSLGPARFAAAIGYRYLHATDRLAIASSSSLIGFPGAITSSDSFRARSDFHGVDLGVIGEINHGPWVLELRTKLALGVNRNEAKINGETAGTFGGGLVTAPGGFLALSSNIGNRSQTRFAAVPELAVKVGYQLTPQWRIVAGYDLLYWSGVQRAGKLIDTTVNPNLLPPAVLVGPQRPQAQFRTTPLLAQGISFGLRCDF